MSQQNKLYVGNLPYTAGENDIREAFKQYGDVQEIKLITDRETGNSKGFAFVTMDTQLAAETSVKNMNGKEIKGRSIKVNIARENNNKRDSRW